MTRIVPALAFVMLAVVPAAAQPAIDRAIRDAVTWPNTTAAERLSDTLVAAALALPCAIEDRAMDCVKKQGIKTAAVLALGETMKRTINRERPDGSDRESFFSSHTALACVAGGSSKKRLALGLAMCAGVGYLRMAAKKHWFTDVAAGIGVGLAFAWIQRE